MSNPIRAHRKNLGLTMAELALSLGVSPALVAQWERGELLPPEARVRALAELLGLGEGLLLTELSVFRDRAREKAAKKLEDALVA